MKEEMLKKFVHLKTHHLPGKCIRDGRRLSSEEYMLEAPQTASYPYKKTQTRVSLAGEARTLRLLLVGMFTPSQSSLG
jgi:hypothetical protein